MMADNQRLGNSAGHFIGKRTRGDLSCQEEKIKSFTGDQRIVYF